MTDINSALTAAHRANIGRYRRLLQTELTDLERNFIHRRLAEEHRALEELRSEHGPGRSAASPPPAQSAADGAPPVSAVVRPLWR